MFASAATFDRYGSIEGVYRTLHAGLALMLCVLARHAAAADWVTVTPQEDPAAVISNPDMGWVLYENYPLDPRPGGSSTLIALPDESFARVDSVALMFAWSDVELREGHYDFSKVDFAYDHWRKRGKRIQLRMSTESLLWWNRLDPPSGVGVPAYVLERLRPEEKQTRVLEGHEYVVVDARNAYYLDRLSAFLCAVNAHYDESRDVTLVDLRGFGVWGEWHSGFRYASIDARRDALKGVIDRFSEAFPNRHVSLSASYDPDMPKPLWDGPTNRFDPAFTKTYDDFLRYSAFDHALTKSNVTFRRDGAGGAVHSNERKLIDEAFATRGKGPMMSEFVDGYADSTKGGEKWVRWKIDDALSLHPNYVNLLGWQGADALNFLNKESALIEHGLRTMGYRLVPTRITYPFEFRDGERIKIESEWINRGVGRAMRDFTLKLTLKDGSGNTVGSTNAGAMNTAVWIKGDAYQVSKEVTFRGIAPGPYRFCLAMIDPKDGATIILPLTHVCRDGSYDVGNIGCR